MNSKILNLGNLVFSQKQIDHMSAIKMRTTTNGKAASAPAVSPSPLKGSDSNCVVSQGTKIEGGFTSSENIRLDGRVEGSLHCDSRLVLGRSGSVAGDIHAENAVISGTVEGNVAISGTLQLTNTAKIQGDIKTKFLIVEEGAVYNGQCAVGG